MNGVRIVMLSRGIDAWFWLCAECLEGMEAQGWELRQVKQSPHPLTCQACKERA